MARNLPLEAQNYLRGLEYPASKADILDVAMDEGADDELIDSMRSQLPDSIYDDPTDVSRALGEKLNTWW
jgi:type IV secretory pathway VirD2 relaxase